MLLFSLGEIFIFLFNTQKCHYFTRDNMIYILLFFCVCNCMLWSCLYFHFMIYKKSKKRLTCKKFAHIPLYTVLKLKVSFITVNSWVRGSNNHGWNTMVKYSWFCLCWSCNCSYTFIAIYISTEVRKECTG